MLKIAKLFYFCHLKELVRPETFEPYYVSMVANESVLMSTRIWLMTSYQFHISIYCLVVLKFLL